MKSRYILWKILCVVIIGAMLAGCGAAPATTPAPTSEPTEETAPTEASEPTAT